MCLYPGHFQTKIGCVVDIHFYMEDPNANLFLVYDTRAIPSPGHMLICVKTIVGTRQAHPYCI